MTNELNFIAGNGMFDANIYRYIDIWCSCSMRQKRKNCAEQWPLRTSNTHFSIHIFCRFTFHGIETMKVMEFCKSKEYAIDVI